MTKSPRRWMKCSKGLEHSFEEKWSRVWQKCPVPLSGIKETLVRCGPEERESATCDQMECLATRFMVVTRKDLVFILRVMSLGFVIVMNGGVFGSSDHKILTNPSSSPMISMIIIDQVCEDMKFPKVLEDIYRTESAAHLGINVIKVIIEEKCAAHLVKPSHYGVSLALGPKIKFEIIEFSSCGR
nr:hypothetical protein [Tanacetum cinerariifolium]